MRRLIALCLVVGMITCQKKPVAVAPMAAPQEIAPLSYSVDLTQISDDLFRCQLVMAPVDDEVVTIQFPASAPGTYQTMDMGRFVRSIEAADQVGNSINLTQASTNQWQFDNPGGPVRISYTIAETWDTKVDDRFIFPMAGTSLEADHALICPHAVFPFPLGYQDRAVALSVQLPETWTVGTAMPFENGAYHAEDYDQFVDSPLLVGNLSVAEETIDGCRFQVYVYSKSGNKKADAILEKLRPVITATGEMLHGFPNDHYAFLFHFEALTMGAWEHAYSSNYVLSDTANETATMNSMVHMAAHEVFHMITPLHIHSEMIDPFDFAEPKPSIHLWFYEGVTEWAARIMMMRAEFITLDRYLTNVGRSIMGSGFFDSSVSLKGIGEASFSPSNMRLFPNVYMKGSLVAALLDLKMLYLTDGKIGLRDVILDLAEDFGPQQTFSEADFFKEIADRSAPEIEEFLNRYVGGIDELPIAECFGYVGIGYTVQGAKLEVLENATAEQLALREIWMQNGAP
ncbi:MAG: peptidase [Acidobacteria bacterium]|nr:peptidase [Acidobacteriota bacterium]